MRGMRGVCYEGYEGCSYLQDIKYQMKLDMYDFCTPELQAKLLPNRMRYKEVEDRKQVSVHLCVTVCVHSGFVWGGGARGNFCPPDLLKLS